MTRKWFWTAWLGVAVTLPAVAASGATEKSHRAGVAGFAF